MEKVKLTKEQAEAIETKKWGTGSAAVAKHLEGWTWKENKCLNDLSMEQFVKALYIGYEVEDTFKVGDWVFDRDSIYKIISKHHVDDLNKGMYSKARHATPEEIAEEKQRRWWAKHGRKVWELRENDLLYYDGEFKDVEEALDYGAIMLSSERAYLPLETIKSKHRIACFAEDRKDVK